MITIYTHLASGIMLSTTYPLSQLFSQQLYEKDIHYYLHFTGEGIEAQISYLC